MYKINSNNLLNKKVSSPVSKSYLHRALFLSTFSKSKFVIKNINYSQDIKATINALTKLGNKFILKKNKIIFIPTKKQVLDNTLINVFDSGTTLRFIIPYILLLNKLVIIDGNLSIKKRPIDSYFDMFFKNNIYFEYNNTLPLILKGILKEKDYFFDMSKSSQFISGLLLVLFNLNIDTNIYINGSYSSIDYVLITLDILNKFGIKYNFDKDNKIIHCYKNQQILINKYIVESDWSNIPFLISFNLFKNKIKIKNISNNSIQGDIRFLEYIKGLGYIIDNNFFIKEYKFKSCIINLNDNPDLFPILVVLSIYTKQEIKFINIKRLIYKESNRIESSKQFLDKLNISYKLDDNNLIIYKHNVSFSKTLYISSYNDHRISMSSFILSLFVKEVYVDNIECINKSFPTFINIFNKIGGYVEEY